eukprot:jgi/Botrbrau1/22454/Bobra.0091s0056.1
MEYPLDGHMENTGYMQQRMMSDPAFGADAEWYQREVIDAELPGEDALEADDEESDPYYFVRKADTGRGDIYLAARTGDLKRVQYLIEEEGVDVNKRDMWDAVPLYYSCLAGHPEVAEYLLEQGAVCNEFTFDCDWAPFCVQCAMCSHISSGQCAMSLPCLWGSVQ